MPATEPPAVHPDLAQWVPSTSTLSKPVLILQAYRGEAMLMGLVMLIVFTFEIAAAATPVFRYKRVSALGVETGITVFHQSMELCLQAGTAALRSDAMVSTAGAKCQTYSISNGQLCDAIASRVSAAGGFCVVAILVSVLGIVNSAFEVKGKAFFTPFATYIVAVVLWWLLFFHFVLDSAAYELPCNGFSMHDLDFSYRSGWVLGFVAWLLLSAALFVYYVRRRVRPVTYTVSGLSSATAAAASPQV